MPISTITNNSVGAAAAIATSKLGAGAVLQVVNASYSTQLSTTSSTPSDTGLTATITPKFATSKILVLADQSGLYASSGGGTTGGYVTLLRGSSYLITMAGRYGGDSGGQTLSIAGTGVAYLDSPATTSATTYKTQYYSAGSQLVYVQVYGATSTITLMEIAV
jgi:hypothetical protein